MFSITTMASSTTRPIASTMPSIVSTLMENPAMYMMKNDPMSEIGITTTGMSVVRQSRRNMKMIITTRMKAVITVSCTSAIDCRMYLVMSNPMASLMSGGRSAWMVSKRR